jgi:diamine N-acetyltransferase
MYTIDSYTMRAIEERDLEALRFLHNDPSTLYWMTDTTIVTPAMQHIWFKGLTAGSSRRYVVESEVGHLVAFIRIDQLNMVNRNACIGLDIFQGHRGRGIGKECFCMLLKYCFEILNLHQVWLYTMATNEASISLYESCGLKGCGRIPDMLRRGGEYVDAILMALTFKDWQRNKLEWSDSQ